MATVEPRNIRLKDGKEIVLRSAEENDAPGLLEFVQIVARDGDGMIAEPDELTRTEEQQRAWIRAPHENPREVVLVAEDRGQIVGVVNFQIGKARRRSHSGSFGMSVHPEWRSRGVGNALLGRLIEWATSVKEIEKIFLGVRADNPRAIALYKKHGFVECGCLKNEVRLSHGMYVDDLWMERFVL